MAKFRIVGAVTTDAGNAFVFGNLVKQARQHWGVAGSIVSHFDSSNFQRTGIDAQLDFAPLSTVLGAMLLGFPFAFAFAQHLDVGAVDQKV